MRSIERRFDLYKSKDPTLGDYLVLVKAVKGQNFTRIIIAHWFKKLIDKDDYDIKDKNQLIKHLLHLSSMAEDS